MNEIRLKSGKISRLTVSSDSVIISVSSERTDSEYNKIVNFGLMVSQKFKPDHTYRGKIYLYRGVCSVSLKDLKHDKQEFKG